jgi:hypothetical protein
MTETEKQILQIIKDKNSLILAGNREYYEILDYARGQFVLHGGDTLSNQEEYRHLISEEEALEKICNYYRNRSFTYPNYTINSREEILAYMKKIG